MYDVCYHHNDLDGWASAALINAKHNISLGYKTKINNSSILNNCQGKKVAIVDFSFPLKTMKFIKDIAEELTWIDHHKESEEIKELGLKGIHDNAKAACLLTWEYLYKAEPYDAIKYAADRDIWLFQYKETKPYCYGLDLLPQVQDPSSLLWKALLKDNSLTKEIIAKGEVVMLKIENDLTWQSRLRVHIVGDNEFIITNATSNISEVAEYLAKLFKIDIVLVWDVSKNGIALHGRGKNSREYFDGLLKGHEMACGGSLDFNDGWKFLEDIYSRARRVLP